MFSPNRDRGDLIFIACRFDEGHQHDDFCTDFVMRLLRAAGVNEPTAYDAQAFIEQVFGDEPSGMRYFEEFYEDRIRALHPESRFGVFPYPPLSMSEGYQLSKALREVWRFLILNRPTGLLG